MTPDPKTFDELAQNVLRGYLRSAVIIDDQWPETVVGEAVVDEIDESTFVASEIPDGVGMEEIGDPAEDMPPPRPADNPEDARLLADLQRALLQEGLLACGFRYTHQDRKVAVALARRADVVVLDWHLVDDDGADALAILEELRRDNELRFVFIFTGHGRIQEVREALKNRFGRASVVSETGEADLRITNLVIAIRNKKGLAEETPGYIVEPGDLLAVALRALVSNYDGLVQLAMLELTQLHRRQLPAILERIDNSIDTAVLLEAGDESSPVGQGGAFLSVLVDEWRAHLEQEHSMLRVLGSGGRQLFGAQLAERLGEVSGIDLEMALERSGVKAAKALANQGSRGQLKRWLAEGCKGSGPVVQGVTLNKDQRPLAGWGVLGAIPGAVEEESAMPLLRLDAFFHQQFERPDELTQGTIVAVHQTGPGHNDYFLCITPACDAVRPPQPLEGRSHLFTFLRATPIIPESLFVAKSKKPAYCVVEHDERLLCLEINLKDKFILAIADREFENDTVQGRLTLGSSVLVASVELRLVAQLRAEHALSITAAAAADASRVGVNRVELVRRRLS